MNKATRKVKVIYYDGYRDYQLVGVIGMATEPNKCWAGKCHKQPFLVGVKNRALA